MDCSGYETQDEVMASPEKETEHSDEGDYEAGRQAVEGMATNEATVERDSNRKEQRGAAAAKKGAQRKNDRPKVLKVKKSKLVLSNVYKKAPGLVLGSAAGAALGYFLG